MGFSDGVRVVEGRLEGFMVGLFVNFAVGMYVGEREEGCGSEGEADGKEVVAGKEMGSLHCCGWL